MKKISPKKRKQNAEWKKVCLEKLEDQIDHRGYNYCELCGNPGSPDKDWNPLWGHHLDRNRANNVKMNCQLLHWICHTNEYHGGMTVNERGRG